MRLLSLLLPTLCVLFQATDAARILALFPFPGPSQYIVVLPYLKELAKRGHEVTSLNAFPQKTPIPNFHDVPSLEVHAVYDEFLNSGVLFGNKWQILQGVHKFLDFVNECTFKSAAVQQLLHSNQTFDLVITETFNNELMYGFAQHFNAMLIGFSSYGTDLSIDDLVGNVSPPAYVPQNDIGFTEHMNFWQRLQNLLSWLLEYFYMHTVFYPSQETLYKQHFPNAKISMMDLRRNFSLMLLNQHFSFGIARPYVPNMIQVGGFHIQHKPAALPADMAAFIAAHPKGVIYFSLGSNIKSKDLPKHIIELLMQTFATLEQGVMWKFESSDLPNKPNNVFVSKWFPQPDILAHPNVKLFITHGGLLSTIEAIYHGKPIIGIPFFYDQFNNVRRAVESGYGLSLDVKTLTAATLKSSIERILTEPNFTRRVKELSVLYHDQPMKPMDVAIYWTEYVLRHKGATHMRVVAQNMSCALLHSLDTLSVIIGAILLVLLTVLLVLRKLFQLVFGKPKNKTKLKAN